MVYASILYRNYKNNSLYRVGAGENNGEFFLPYSKLRDRFLAAGIELNTPDVNAGRKVAFELHINCRRQNPKARAYVYLYENPLIRLVNRDRAMLARYAKWFAWDAEVLDDGRAIQLFYPNSITISDFSPPQERQFFLGLVTTNNALKKDDPRGQFRTRIQIIEWYEKHAPESFYLYGRDWDCPPALPGQLGQIYNKAWKRLAKFFKIKSRYVTWRGPIDNKNDLLQRVRFYIAYENCRDLPGYITEKLFDCFRAGCVPIYIGPKEIHDFIPEECFIDGRKFSNPAEMDAFLRAIDDEAYCGYQKAIREFLLSEKARPFSQEHFVETIVRTILADLAENKS